MTRFFSAMALSVIVLLVGSITLTSLSSDKMPQRSTPIIGVDAPMVYGTVVSGNAILAGRITGGLAVGGELSVPRGMSLAAATTCRPHACGSAGLAFGILHHLWINDAKQWSELPVTMSNAPTTNGISIRGTNPIRDVAELTDLDAGTADLMVMAPRSATVIVNVAPAAAKQLEQLHGITLVGVDSTHVLWNFGADTEVNLPATTWYGTIFGPTASLTGAPIIDGDIIVDQMPLQSGLHRMINDSTDGFTGLLPQFPITQALASVTHRPSYAPLGSAPQQILAPRTLATR